MNLDIDILGLITNLLVLTLLGILVAFNPLLIMMDLVIVLKSKRPILNTILLGSGVAAAVFVIFVVATRIASTDQTLDLTSLRSRFDLPPYIDLIAGILLIYLALQGLRKHREESFKPIAKRSQQSVKVPEKPFALFFFAFFKSLVSVTNIVAALILSRLSISNDWGLLPGTVALVWALVIGIVPFGALVYLKMTGKASLSSVNEWLNSQLSRDTKLVIPALFGAIGMLLIFNAVITIT